MAEIIQFRPRVKSGSMGRVEALVKGKIEEYDCNNCNETFEVIDNNFPQFCPKCKAYIDWENSKK